ncbi:F0F1 ATP synthase subunit gamma [Candidatus Saccharibacteria bacterium]|nr:F0F1 ATP synthase subunit gamma [Candidatus Saccharibacteria bacterium]
MKKSAQTYAEYQDVLAIEDISHILESIASIRIRQIKDQVIASREFFQRLWRLYSQLRISQKEEELLEAGVTKSTNTAVVLVTGNAGLSGEIDSQLVNTVLDQIISPDVDFFVIGLHGRRLLEAHGIQAKASYPLPDVTKPIEINDVIEQISHYQAPLVYYQSFASLSVQQVIHFSLVETVRRISEQEQANPDAEVITAEDYLFEPNLEELARYLQNMMLNTTLLEVILESSLAQFASRFTAMNSASVRAKHISQELFRSYSRQKRYEKDELSRRYKHRQRRSV